MADVGTLRLNGDGDVEIELLGSFLTDLNRAYSSILTFDQIISRLDRYPIRYFLDEWDLRRSRGPRALRNPFSLLTAPNDVDLFVSHRERLVLARVELASPGFWEFVGKLNPLEVLRQYLDDRHRRRQDRDYRESAEARKLELENLLLENQVLSQRMEIARELGFNDADMAPLVRQLIERPLAKLADYQDRGVIEGANLEPPPGDREGRT